VAQSRVVGVGEELRALSMSHSALSHVFGGLQSLQTLNLALAVLALSWW